MSRTRRAFLASGAALLAGCLSSDRATRTTPKSPTPTTSPPTVSPTPTGPPSVSFVGYAVQRSAFYPRHPDFAIVWAPPDRQLLFAMVTVEDGEPTDLSFDNFSLRIDHRTVAEAEGVEGQEEKTYYPRPDECDCDTQYETYATFPLAAPLAVEQGMVRWEGPDKTQTWALPDDARSALAAPTTTWQLASFTAPDSVGPNESFTVSFKARNDGNAPGTFRGVLNQTGPMYGVSDQWKTEIAAGTTFHRESTISILEEISSDVSNVQLNLRTVAGNVDHTVRVD